MRFKKITVITLAAVLAAGTLITPAAKMQTEAAYSPVYTGNQDIPKVNIQTPQNTLRLYTEMSWEELEENIGVRLAASKVEVGPAAKNTLDYVAASFGAVAVETIKMRLEKYKANSGWTEVIEEMPYRIRVCITLPAGSDPAKDYAVISLKEAGAYEVLGDLDQNPATITVDTNYFNTYRVIAASAGTFNQYRVINPNALDKLEIPSCVKRVPSAINTQSYDSAVQSLGIITDAATTWAAVGGSWSSLELWRVRPGKNAIAAMDNALRNIKAEREQAEEDKKLVNKFYGMILKNPRGEVVTQTNGKLRITMAVPSGVPAYADYAMAVLNQDGSVSILKDIDIDAGAITFDTDQFRLFVFLWGRKGAFDNIK